VRKAIRWRLDLHAARSRRRSRSIGASGTPTAQYSYDVVDGEQGDDHAAGRIRSSRSRSTIPCSPRHGGRRSSAWCVIA
jgi:hypothetical protein